MLDKIRERIICCWRLSTWIKAIGWLQIIFFTFLTWNTLKIGTVIGDEYLEHKRLVKIIQDRRYDISGGSSNFILMRYASHLSRSSFFHSDVLSGNEFFPGWAKQSHGNEERSIWEVMAVLLVLEIYSLFGLLVSILLLTGVAKKKPNFLTSWTIFASFSLVVFTLLIMVIIFLLTSYMGLLRLLLILSLLCVAILWSIWLVRIYKQELEVQLIHGGGQRLLYDDENFQRDPRRFV